MQEWSEDVFGNIQQWKIQLLTDIQNLDGKKEAENLEDVDKERRQYCQEQFQSLIFHEAIKWKQQSRNKWLEADDRNTKKFPYGC